MNRIKNRILIAILSLAASSAFGHDHINAGAYDTDNLGEIVAGDPLVLEGIPLHGVELLDNGGTGREGEDGFLYSGTVTFTATDSFLYNPATRIGGAIEGSFLKLQFFGVESGPVGGIFAFYESSATDPTLQFTVNSPTAYVGEFDLSVAANQPNAAGHVHGRSYAATLPGTYATLWKTIDASGNQTDSEIYTVDFVAVPELNLSAALMALAASAGFLWMRRRKN